METAYSLELIEHILRVKGPAWLCDEIMRDEDPSTSESFIRWNILTYLDREDFAGRRLLDFGSGCGASTMVLSRMFPQTWIVGVELVSESVEVARKRAEFYGVTDRVRFALSPDSNSLPAGIGGDFDYVVLSGVYEHLLPEERQSVIPSSGRDCDTEACSSSSKLLTDGFPSNRTRASCRSSTTCPTAWLIWSHAASRAG